MCQHKQLAFLYFYLTLFKASKEMFLVSSWIVKNKWYKLPRLPKEIMAHTH